MSDVIYERPLTSCSSLLSSNDEHVSPGLFKVQTLAGFDYSGLWVDCKLVLKDTIGDLNN